LQEGEFEPTGNLQTLQSIFPGFTKDRGDRFLLPYSEDAGFVTRDESARELPRGFTPQTDTLVREIGRGNEF
jgi:hypothetical protein